MERKDIENLIHETEDIQSATEKELEKLKNKCQQIQEYAKKIESAYYKLAGLITGNEKLFKNFKVIEESQLSLIRCLMQMEEDGDICVRNWHNVLSGMERIIWVLPATELLAFMQAMQNNGIILNHGIEANKHCERIIAIFEPERFKEGEDEFILESLKSQYTRKKNKKNGQFYHHRIKYFERKLFNS